MNWKMVGTLILGVGLLGACAAPAQQGAPESTSATRLPEDEEAAAKGPAAQPAPTASGVILTDRKPK